VTVLSRCQRFDLRRVEGEVLVAHLKSIAEQEKIDLDDEAAAVIARAAEGSVRDGLSILDQAIAHGSGTVRADDVRDMLGLADRARIIDLFDAIVGGDVAKALGELKDQYDSGADPAMILSDLAAFVHFITRAKFVPEAADDPALSESEREAGHRFAGHLDMRVLARAWQVLLKGIEETRAAVRPFVATEMVVVRLAHMADLPTPDELIRSVTKGNAGKSSAARRPQNGSNGPRPQAQLRGESDPQSVGEAQQTTSQQPAPAPFHKAAQPASELTSFEDVVRLAGERRDVTLKVALEQHVRPVRFEPGKIEIDLTPRAPENIAHDLSRRLLEWTGERWMVGIAAGKGGQTLSEANQARRDSLLDEARQDPFVRQVMDQFPGSEITDVRENRIDATDQDVDAHADTESNQGVSG